MKQPHPPNERSSVPSSVSTRSALVQLGRYMLGVLLLALLVAGCQKTPQPPPAPTDTPTVPAPTATPTVPAPTATPTAIAGIPVDAVEATLLRVVDGDTIHVSIQDKEETVRYVGVDTPERNQPGYQAATEANRALLGDGMLYLEPDQSDRDNFGRLLRFVYTGDGTFVNRELVFQGWAQPVEYSPDISRATEFRQMARDAAEAKRGFWSGTSPYDGAMPYGLSQGPVELQREPNPSSSRRRTIPAGTPLTIYGRSSGGRWLQVRTPERAGGWVDVEAIDVNVSLDAIPVTAETDGEQPTPIPVADLDGVTLQILENYQSFELLALENQGSSTVDISGWQLHGSTGSEECTIPADTELAPGQHYEVATGDSEPGDRGYKCSSQAIWNNSGETIFLDTVDGRQISIESETIRP